ncbi:thioredoxin family protein [Cohnella lubricantis]|uniref:Thioredoxin family protein n=1 Tax=Cohnella lubricantis TaxID=2163172 RepID=A0A841T3N2_9BACL|nr:thioredoxin family protein [Cohnella lubricantis]
MPDLILIHTPLCGTCAVARKMLAVVEAMMPELTIDAANLNFMPGLAEAFRIESVPCLLIRETDGSWSKIYKFGSVVELAARIRQAGHGRITGEERNS